jgi:branched-chain amino acid transport system permease protein
VVFAIFALLVVAIRRSGFGERLLAMKDSPAACATLGLNLTLTKLAVFTLSAAMAGIGGALYASTLGSVSPELFNLFQSLPLVLLAVVGGIGSPGGALFAGIVLGGIPIVVATFTSLEKPLGVLPGLLGISLADNPNGTVPDLARRFQPVKKVRGVLVGLLVVLAGLYVAERAGALAKWPFAILIVVATFASIPVAELILARRERGPAELAEVAPAEVPLEWVGIERPFTEDDVEALDKVLALPGLSPQ